MYSDYGTLDYQPGFSTEFCTPITVLLTRVTHGMLHELVYLSKQFDSCHTYCKSSIPPGGVFISNSFEGEGVGAFLEAGGLIEAIINLGQNMARYAIISSAPYHSSTGRL